MSSLNPPPFTGGPFIVRIWLEWSKDGPCWRGQIVNVQSREKRYFLALEDMLKFIREFVSMPEKEGGDVDLRGKG